MPTKLERLIARLARLVRAATAALESDPARVEAWEQTMQRLITRYSTAAMLAGAKAQTLTPQQTAAIKQSVAAQLDFLRNFAVTIQGDKEWQTGWNARAESYANGIKTPYWQGATKMLPLPAMPTEGTQCMGNCNCLWEIETVNEAAGDYDCYWRRGAGDSCQTCKQRAADWSPVRIRGGSLQ